MKIDFNSIEERSIPNFKGGEKALAARMFTDGNGNDVTANYSVRLVGGTLQVTP